MLQSQHRIVTLHIVYDDIGFTMEWLWALSKYRSLWQKSPIKETLQCQQCLVTMSHHRSLLQKSPIKETIFCKRDLTMSTLCSDDVAKSTSYSDFTHDDGGL